MYRFYPLHGRICAALRILLVQYHPIIFIYQMTNLDVAAQVGPSDDEDRLPAKLQAPVEARRGSRWILRARCHSFVEEYLRG